MEMETLPSGTILRGRYRIERVLGSGGFGHVYQAIDLQTNQQYAVKEYLVTGASGKAQLEHEARVLGQLHHPNLPAFQEAFDERGRYYVVLGYIEGNDLTDYIRVVRQRNEVIPLPRIMGWILSICDAVSFLHSQHPPVIHRDIKPDNIRIMPDGTAILVDLGNAKAAADGARTLFFIRHQGTPGYAPLEQYPGGTGTDARSDIYALGGTLYFALTTHEPPSVSARNQAIAQGQLDLPSLQEQLARNPPENSTESQVNRQFRLGVSKPAKPLPRHSRHLAQLGGLPPALLERLNRIIIRAMAMKQKDRYQSVADFSADLRMVLREIQSSPPPTPSGPSQPLDTHSTQPDLPFLFESMQQEKEKNDQGPSNTRVASTSQPAASSLRCPRCNAELLPKAVYCPQCGTELANMFKTKAAPPSASNTTGNNPTSSKSKDTPADPATRSTPQTSVQRLPPNPRASASSTTLSRSPDMGRLPSHTPAQNRVASTPQVSLRPFMQSSSQDGAPLQLSQTPSDTTTTRPAQPDVPDSSQRTLLILGIILVGVLLVAAIVIFALRVHHGAYYHLPGTISTAGMKTPTFLKVLIAEI